MGSGPHQRDGEWTTSERRAVDHIREMGSGPHQRDGQWTTSVETDLQLPADYEGGTMFTQIPATS